MQKIFKYIIFILIGLTISCSSPLDIDTPRKKIVPDNPNPVQLNLIEYSLETNGEDEPFLIDKNYAEIDTSSSYSIWGNLKINWGEISNFSKKRLQIISLSLGLDSIPITGSPSIIYGNEQNGSYAKYIINRGISISFNDTLFADTVKNKTEISFSFDKPNKSLWIYINSSIYQDRVEMESDTSQKVKSISDSLFIVGRFHFNY